MPLTKVLCTRLFFSVLLARIEKKESGYARPPIIASYCQFFYLQGLLDVQSRIETRLGQPAYLVTFLQVMQITRSNKQNWFYTLKWCLHPHFILECNKDDLLLEMFQKTLTITS